jgi:hypothetical protein
MENPTLTDADAAITLRIRGALAVVLVVVPGGL